MTRFRFTFLTVVATAIAAGTLCAPAFAQDHQHHNMTPEVMAELRSKVALYREYTDEQIMESMERMGPNYEAYVSDASVTGKVGVMGLAHGSGEIGDAALIDQFGHVSDTYPTAMGFGMAMMTSAHIQSGIDQLVEAGAETIIVIPAIDVKYGSVLPQWEYIFGQRDEARYISVPQIETPARVILAESPADHSIVSSIMIDHARDISTDPGNELVIIVSHGPADLPSNEKELAILETHADAMRNEGTFKDVRAITLQDDAPSAIRAANVENFRKWVETARDEGKEVIIVTNLLTTGSVQKKIERDLAGLNFKFNTNGLSQHERFVEWVQDSIDQQLGDS